jgi:two-component system, OmpR family, copper resistance phosphate regulon response regulator CusR
MKLLLIEDDKKVAAFIRHGLTEQSYSVDVAHDGLQGERMAQDNEYDVIIVDIMLPRKSGFAVTKSIRTFDTRVPILILTALDATEDKLQGFDVGADDYLVKPFEFRELLARIRALLRRSVEGVSGASLEIADVKLDVRIHSVTRGGTKVDLTAKEDALLEYFMRNRGRLISRAEIAEHVWDTWFDSDSNVIDVYVSFLRKKIDRDRVKKLIHTVIGMGYIFKED